MNPAVGSRQRSASVQAYYLLPHCFLDLAADGDTAEVRCSKARRNKTALLRWLPICLRRWGLLFLASWHPG